MSPDDELPPTVSGEACTLRQLIRQGTFPDTGTDHGDSLFVPDEEAGEFSLIGYERPDVREPRVLNGQDNRRADAAGPLVIRTIVVGEDESEVQRLRQRVSCVASRHQTGPR